MKRLTTFLLTLLLFTLGASAQTDYTWALGSGTWHGNSGTYGSGVEVYQTSAFSSGKVLYETVTGLPAGEYTLTFYAVPNYTSGRGFTAAYGDGIAQVYATANGTTQTKDVTVIEQSGCEPSEYPYEFTVEVGNDGELEYGLQNIAAGGNWYVCQGVSLFFSGEATTRELEPGDVVEEELGDESSLSHYSLTYTGTGTNGGLDYNTWSGESGMTTPYHQVWVYMGDNKDVTLSDMTINHYEIPLLPAGTYTVTVDARVLSEANNAISTGSAFFCANDASVDIVAEATTDENFEYGTPVATEHEVNGTYTLTATVGDDGTLDISFTIKDATYNWVSWKNLSVTYLGEAEEEEPGIEEPTDIDSDYHTGDVITVGGVDYTVLGENLVPNHSFELGFTGWTNSQDYTTEITSSNFKLVNTESDDDQISGDQYLVGTTWAGSAAAGSLGTAWKIEEGKTYYFSYNIKNLSNAEETEYLKTSLTNTPGTETEPLGYPASVSAEWQTEEYVFDSKTYDYVQIKFRWLATEQGTEQWGFDNFQIYEVEEVEVEPEPEVTGTYEFVAEDWVASDNGRVTASGITYNADNTITVVADGQNNIALGNNPSQWWDATNHDVTTADYTITKDQSNFVIIGSDLATGSTDSYWWWMNGVNDYPTNYGQIVPDEVVTLSDGQVLVAWDISGYIANNMTVDEDGLITLNGGTCFGLTSTAEDHSATISDINFYTDEELEAIIAGEPEPVDGNDNDYEVGDVVTVDGKECTIVGENLMVNGGFGDGVNGWSANLYTEDAVLDNFTYATDGGYNDGAYITINANGGAVSVNNLSQAIQVEEGKTYLFIGYTKGTAPTTGNMRYCGVMQMSDATTEILDDGKTSGHDAVVEVQMAWGADEADQINGWTQTEGVFTASTPYVGVRTAWCGSASFDGIQIYEVEVAEVEPEPTPEYVYETVYECVADGADWQKPDHWTAANDATTNLHINTHSTEADPSGMVTPFVEYWYASGTNLPDDVLSHDKLTGLEAGDYKVTIEVRAFNESGATAITAGTTFNANDASVDITEAGLESSTAFSGHYELYGEIAVETAVTEAGTMDINFTVENANYNWLAFKNLKVAKMTSTADIELTAVEGVMNAAVEATMEDAIATFEKTRTASSYYAAVAAIEAAEASVEYYAPIVAAVDALDEDGAAVWAESDYAEALENRTLTNEDVNADVAAAQKAQTTAGSDMTYVALCDGDWSGNTGTYQTGVERYGDEIELEDDETVKVLYKTIEGLTPGTYTVTFYAVANNAWVGAAYGDGIAQAFANETAVDIEVYDQTACTLESEEYLYTITCTVGVDGVLEFGLQNVATGGNWYVAEAVSLTLVEALDSDLVDLIIRYSDDCTAAEKCEANLADMIENGDKTDETKAEMAEALEALEAVMAEYGGIDTSDASAIDVDELTAACEAIEAALAEAQDVYATGLQSVTVATESDAIYTLSGVRVSKAVKGVYIVNGKKVLVK